MKMSHFQQIESAIPKLINIELPIKIAYKLNVLMDDIDKHLERLQKFRATFLEKYGERVNENHISIKKDKIKMFDDGMAELLDEEIDIQVVEIPLSLLIDTTIRFTVLEIEALKNSGFVVDDISTDKKE